MTSELRNPEARLTDWGKVLGGRISNCLPADIDGVMERNGYLLFLEAKRPGEKLSVAQAMTLNALLGQGATTCCVLTLQDDVACHMWAINHLGRVYDMNCTNGSFRGWVTNWLAYVTSQPRLPDMRMAADEAIFTERRC